MQIAILGTRGIPASHGGFETFAEHLSCYLVDHGHRVTVYCQVNSPAKQGEDSWRGVQRVLLYAPDTAWGSVIFDAKCVRHAASRSALILTLGYNTAIFSLRYRLAGRVSLMNMDGIEWKRQKWSWTQRQWLRANEFFGAKCSSHLIADHPEIARHLESLAPPSKITVIPYGADKITSADASKLASLDLQPDGYAVVIARPEPENSILEIVRAFSRAPRGYRLVVLGTIKPNLVKYHQQLVSAASSEVIFPGAIYDREVVEALRFYARFYLHGHQVGGTNPSLVEALAAGSAVIAHRNRFNLWVAGAGAEYFSDEDELAQLFLTLGDDPAKLKQMRAASAARHAQQFTLEKANSAYEKLLMRFAQADTPSAVSRLNQAIP